MTLLKFPSVALVFLAVAGSANAQEPGVSAEAAPVTAAESPAAPALPSPAEPPPLANPQDAAAVNAPAPGDAAAPAGSPSAAPEAGAPVAAAEAPPPPPPPKPTLIVKADLAAQSVTVIENGRVTHTWPISSGTKGYRTQTGTFTPTWTSRMHYSRQWDWAPMPYAVFFNRGTAFHGTAATGRLGRPASHGCIRLATGNAKTLYNLVHKHGQPLTRVVVHGAPKFKEPRIATARDPSRYGARPARPRYASSSSAPYDQPPRRRRQALKLYQAPLGSMWD